MVITAVVDTISEGNAVLLSEDTGIEITIPVDELKGSLKVGEHLNIVIDGNGEITNSYGECSNE